MIPLNLWSNRYFDAVINAVISACQAKNSKVQGAKQPLYLSALLMRLHQLRS